MFLKRHENGTLIREHFTYHRKLLKGWLAILDGFRNFLRAVA
jgi:hypothetical protein